MLRWAGIHTDHCTAGPQKVIMIQIHRSGLYLNFSYDEFSIWASEKCTPLVREITFENAEELTEEGLPFLILFHNPDDNESIKKFTDVVQTQLIEDKRKI